jgi:hypothetical protein
MADPVVVVEDLKINIADRKAVVKRIEEAFSCALARLRRRLESPRYFRDIEKRAQKEIAKETGRNEFDSASRELNNEENKLNEARNEFYQAQRKEMEALQKKHNEAQREYDVGYRKANTDIEKRRREAWEVHFAQLMDVSAAEARKAATAHTRYREYHYPDSEMNQETQFLVNERKEALKIESAEGARIAELEAMKCEAVTEASLLHVASSVSDLWKKWAAALAAFKYKVQDVKKAKAGPAKKAKATAKVAKKTKK